MKLERISENQIRCTLDKADLADKDLKLNELAYGTEKAKALFREMMQQASSELGFEADDIPLMIEAIPVSPESLILIITKVDDPEELDARFSRFSKPAGFGDDDDDDPQPSPMDSIMNIIGNIVSDIEKAKESVASAAPATPVAPATSDTKSIGYSIYHFNNMNDLMRASLHVSDHYVGNNSLYKDENNKGYYLLLEQGDTPVDVYNRTLVTLSEYATREKSVYARKQYMAEHFQVILKDHALSTLKSL